MTLHDERALAIITQRNGVLSTLLSVYPDGLDGRTLYRVLLGQFPALEKDYFRRDVFYLVEKGYLIECSTVATSDWEKKAFRLTAEGNEFANRLIADPALEP